MPQSQLTPASFVAKWKRAKLSERATSQEHFIDLCRLLGHSPLRPFGRRRPIPKPQKRTLTNLCNQLPTWLKLAHEKSDRAVLAAYHHIDPTGAWSEDSAALYTETGAGAPLPPDHPRAKERSETDQKTLTNLLRLNHQRAILPR